MEPDISYSPGPAVQFLHRMLRYLRVALMALLALTIPLLAVSPWGDTAVPATISEPVVVGLADGRLIHIDSGRIRTYENFPIGDEHQTLEGGAVVAADVNVPRDDLASRAISLGRIGVYLAALWVGFAALYGVVSAAARGEPFDRKNPVRLRRLAWAAISVPVVTFASQLALNQTLTSDIAVQVSFDSPWIYQGLVGLACFALAEVFATAVRLHEFEQATI